MPLALWMTSFSLVGLLSQTQNSASPRQEPDYVTVGLGMAPEYPGADGLRVIPFGAFRVATPIADIQSRGLQVGADVLAPWQRGARMEIGFGPQLGVRFGRRSDNSDRRVEALGSVDDALEAGMFAGIAVRDVAATGDKVALRLDWAHDVTGAYGGSLAGASLAYVFATPPYVGVILSVSTTYAGRAYQDRLYSVTAEQAAAAGLSAYDATAGVNQVSAGLNLRQALTRYWFVSAQATLGLLVGDAARSPVVEQTGSRLQPIVALTVGRIF